MRVRLPVVRQVVIWAREARPDRVFVHLYAFITHPTKYHGAEFSTSHGQGVIPIFRRFVIPEFHYLPPLVWFREFSGKIAGEFGSRNCLDRESIGGTQGMVIAIVQGRGEYVSPSLYGERPGEG